MAWRNPFRRNDENTRHAWGYSYQWTPEHLTPEELHPMKYTYDVLGEQALKALDRINPPLSSELPRNQSRSKTKEGVSKPKRDLYSLLEKYHSEDEKLTELWDEVNTIPEWVDWDQISRGQEAFYRYGGVALTAVRFLSSFKTLADSAFKVSFPISLGWNGRWTSNRSLGPYRRLLCRCGSASSL